MEKIKKDYQKKEEELSKRSANLDKGEPVHQEIELMFRMYLMQNWFNLSDEKGEKKIWILGQRLQIWIMTAFVLY